MPNKYKTNQLTLTQTRDKEAFLVSVLIAVFLNVHIGVMALLFYAVFYLMGGGPKVSLFLGVFSGAMSLVGFYFILKDALFLGIAHFLFANFNFVFVHNAPEIGHHTDWLWPLRMASDYAEGFRLPSFDAVWRLYLNPLNIFTNPFYAGIMLGFSPIVGSVLFYRRAVAAADPTVDSVEKHMDGSDENVAIGPLRRDHINNHKRAAYDEAHTLIGTDSRKRLVTLQDKVLFEHSLVIGTTGSGKTVTMTNFAESSIQKGRACIFVDGKGDTTLADKVEKFAHQNGRKAYKITLKPNCTHVYNPLNSGNYEDKADSIINLYNDQNEFYREVAHDWLQSVFRVLELTGVEVDIHTLTTYMDKDELIKLIRSSVEADALDQHRGQDLIKKIERKKKAIEEQGSMGLQISRLADSSKGYWFDTSNPDYDVLDLDEAIEEGAVVYFCIPAMSGTSQAESLGRIIVNDIKATLAQRQSRRAYREVQLIFDEFSVFAGKQVEELLLQGRSFGAMCILGSQSFAHLRGPDGDEDLAASIRSCSNTLIVHKLRGGSYERETAAEMIGATESVAVTNKFSSDSEAHEGTRSSTYEFRVNPAKFDRLDNKGEGYVLSQFKTHRGLKTQCKKIQARRSLIDQVEV